MLCSHCADNSDPALARRQRVLQLLTLVEHPEALPAQARLRIAQEILASMAQGGSGLQCRRPATSEPRRVATAA